MERPTLSDVDNDDGDNDCRSDDEGKGVEIDRRTSFASVRGPASGLADARFVERDDPVDVGVDVDAVRVDSERVSRVDEDRETTVGDGAPTMAMASAASVASVDARGPVRPSVRDATRGAVERCAPSSVAPVVRASSRRRKDSAAAAPAPVTTEDRDEAGLVARDVDVGRVAVVDVAADADRDVEPDAKELRLWIVPARSDDEDDSMPIWRSATVRATKPTNGDRAEPPGKVVTRSTVAFGCKRGPV